MKLSLDALGTRERQQVRVPSPRSLPDYGRIARLRTESCWNDCLQEGKQYQTVRTITRSLRGRSGATTNRSKPSDNVPSQPFVKSQNRRSTEADYPKSAAPPRTEPSHPVVALL